MWAAIIGIIVGIVFCVGFSLIFCWPCLKRALTGDENFQRSGMEMKFDRSNYWENSKRPVDEANDSEQNLITREMSTAPTEENITEREFEISSNKHATCVNCEDTDTKTNNAENTTIRCNSLLSSKRTSKRPKEPDDSSFEPGTGICNKCAKNIRPKATQEQFDAFTTCTCDNKEPVTKKDQNIEANCKEGRIETEYDEETKTGKQEVKNEVLFVKEHPNIVIDLTRLDL